MQRKDAESFQASWTLARLVLYDAGSWRCEPAQRDGIEVASAILVRLDFEPPPQ